jgi:hypothetical protein
MTAVKFTNKCHPACQVIQRHLREIGEEGLRLSEGARLVKRLLDGLQYWREYFPDSNCMAVLVCTVTVFFVEKGPGKVVIRSMTYHNA